MGMFDFISDIFDGGGGSTTTVQTTSTQKSQQDIAVTVNPTFKLATTHNIENIIETKGLTEVYAQYGQSIERSQKSVADAIRSQSYATGEANYLEGQQFSWLQDTVAVAGERIGGIVTISVLLIATWVYFRYAKN